MCLLKKREMYNYNYITGSKKTNKIGNKKHPPINFIQYAVNSIIYTVSKEGPMVGKLAIAIQMIHN